MFPTFFPAAECCMCTSKVIQFHYLYSKAFTVVAFKSQALQVSGVLMYVTYLLSLYQSVNSSVWGLCVCIYVCACVHSHVCTAGSVCENVTVCLRSINKALC